MRGLKLFYAVLHPMVFLSHPTWVRGLKLCLITRFYSCYSVAPYVGAWIETLRSELIYFDLSVAPYVGAWIETALRLLGLPADAVAPYVGAWIET